MFFTCGVCSGQNLVPNPSFEDTVQCPDALNQVNNAMSWVSVRPSPDYFNLCAPNGNNASVPNNFYGYRIPASGVAYAGFGAKFATNGREYLGTSLVSPLQIGLTYYVSFKVSLIKQWVNGVCAVNKLGILFSTFPYSISNPAPKCNCAQVFTDSIVADTINWTMIKGSFVADSTYTFISIGNFFVDSLIASIQIQPGPFCLSYYYLDDVCVSTDSLTCNSTVGINEAKNNDEFILFPNPFSNKLAITSKTNQPLEITLFDITSRKLLHQQFTNSTSINTSHLSKGIYIYELRNKNGVIKKGKVVRD
jgi:hypothetical protein